MEIGLMAYRGISIKRKVDEAAVRESLKNETKIIQEKLKMKIRYCAFREGVPSKALWKFIQAQGFDAVFTQCPTNRGVSNRAVGRIQIDDDDLRRTLVLEATKHHVAQGAIKLHESGEFATTHLGDIAISRGTRDLCA